MHDSTPDRPPAAASRRARTNGSDAARNLNFADSHGGVTESVEIVMGEGTGQLQGLPAFQYAITHQLKEMVGKVFVVRHLISVQGIALNGRRCRVMGHDQINFSSVNAPRMHCKFEGAKELVRIKPTNLAEPGSFVDTPSRTRIPDAALLPLLRMALAELQDVGQRADMVARCAWLRSQLETGRVPASTGCMDPLLTPAQLQENDHVRLMMMGRPSCCGDGTVDFARFGEGLSGGGETCAVCFEPVPLGAPALGLPCSHVFHQACAAPWIEQHNTCPTCRHALPRDLATGRSFVRPEASQVLLTRLKEWLVSGMCERCQASYHEGDPLIAITGANGVARLVPHSLLERRASRA